MFRIPQKNEDLRHYESILSPEERLLAVTERKRLTAIRELGSRWLLAPDYNGHYEPVLSPKAGS